MALKMGISVKLCRGLQRIISASQPCCSSSTTTVRLFSTNLPFTSNRARIPQSNLLTGSIIHKLGYSSLNLQRYASSYTLVCIRPIFSSRSSVTNSDVFSCRSSSNDNCVGENSKVRPEPLRRIAHTSNKNMYDAWKLLCRKTFL